MYLGHDPNIMAWDIIPIVRQAWKKSFGDVASNKEALAERGWNPFNYALFQHPFVQNASLVKLSK